MNEGDVVEEGCGDLPDHDLREVEVRDGLRTSWCRNCGAEIVEEVED